MRKKTILKIERDLKARAKKMRLGKKRTGAYVYGTLRKLQKNPMITGEGIDRYRLLAIKQGLRARKIGMMVTRGATTKKLLGLLSQYTGEKYSSRDIDRGISDAERLLKSDVDMTMQRKIASGVVGENSSLRRQKLADRMGNQYFPGTMEAKLKKLRKIVSERQNAVVDGKRVDLYSASAIVSVYDKLNPDNQEKFLKMPVRKMADVAFRIITAREVRANPANDVLELLSQDQIVKEYRKSAKGEPSKMMFTSKPMSGSSAAQLVRKIGNYNNFSWRRVMPFLGKLDYATAALPLPLEFRVGREYSPTIYIENVEMPRYANQIIEYARERLKVSEANYVPVARRIRLWWD